MICPNCNLDVPITNPHKDEADCITFLSSQLKLVGIEYEKQLRTITDLTSEIQKLKEINKPENLLALVSSKAESEIKFASELWTRIKIIPFIREMRMKEDEIKKGIK